MTPRRMGIVITVTEDEDGNLVRVGGPKGEILTSRYKTDRADDVPDQVSSDAFYMVHQWIQDIST